jgi:tRNA A37 threonylcarbamoyladenosine dehydratase
VVLRSRRGKQDAGACSSSRHGASTISHKDDAAGTKHLPDDIRDEQLSRHSLYFGEDGMEKLKRARVCVVGAGGVGSHAAVMLARSGLGFLRCIDFDQVTVSSLNRHACAVLDDVGIPKVTCLASYCRKICPDERHLRIETFAEMYTAETGERLLAQEQQWDMVLDCIDDTSTKAALLAYCLQQNIRVVSCMGAGGKADFTRLHLSDLRSAAKDPLASSLRQVLRKVMPPDSSDAYLDDRDRLAVLYSSEGTVKKLADFTEQQKRDGVHQYGAVDGMRIRVVPVLGTMPAIMGQAVAAACLTEICGQPLQPVPGERVGRNVRNKMFQHLKGREQLLAKRVLQDSKTDASEIAGNGCVVDGAWIGPLQVDSDDVEFLLEMWRNRCATTQVRQGTVLKLIRWDLSKPSTTDNLILMSVHQVEKFDRDPFQFKASLDDALRRRIEERLASCCRQDEGY